MRQNRSVVFVLIADMLSILASFYIFNVLPIPTWIQCSYPQVQNIAFALCTSLVAHILVINRVGFINNKPIVLIYSLLFVLTLWLGSYSYSPLGFSTGRIPLLRGFIVTRNGRPAISIASGDIVTIAPGSVTGFKPITLPGNMDCFWASTTGGVLDDPGSCEIAYFASGGADFDILKLHIQPGCQLPNALGEIRISIQP